MALKTKFETRTYMIAVNTEQELPIEVTRLDTGSPSRYMVRVGNREMTTYKFSIGAAIAALLNKQHRITHKDTVYFAMTHTINGIGQFRSGKEITFKRKRVVTQLDEYIATMIGGEEPIKSDAEISVEYALGGVLREYGL